LSDLFSSPGDYRDPRLTSLFDELSVWSARFGAVLLDRMPLAGGSRVLDLGCGPGFPLVEIAQRLGSSSQVWGADIWRAALHRARWKREALGLSHLALAEADGAALPFASGSFDLVVSNLGVNNFADPAAALAECARCLRPGGALCLTSNLTGHMAEVYATLRSILEESGDTAAVERLGAQERHRGSRERLTALLVAAGFEVVQAYEWSFEMRYADGAAMLRHSLTRFGFLEGWASAVEPEQREEVFEKLERSLDEAARRGGELRVSVPAIYLEARRDSEPPRQAAP
jgi:ubiquinone/menaquinone biosynthesis C-methylase UbiE